MAPVDQWVDDPIHEGGWVDDPTPDVRSQIAERKANPPAAAMGDPRVKKTSTFEETLPFAAHPIETVKGFGGAMMGGVKALAHPIDSIKADWNTRGEAANRIKERGIGSDDPENLRDLVEASIPIAGPAFASVGRKLNSPDPIQRAQGTGEGIALTSGPQIVRGAFRAATPAIEAQVQRYMKVLDPEGKSPEIARHMAQRLIDEGKTLTQPKAQLTAIQEGRSSAASAGIDQAIDNMPNPVNLEAVNQNIQAGRAAQMKPFGPDTAATVRAVDKHAKVLPMNAIGDVASKADVIPPQAARQLRQQFDAKPYGSNSSTADTAGRKVIGDALRQELNKDPGVKSANEAFRREKAGKDLAEAIPDRPQPTTAKTVGRVVAKSAVTALAGVVGGPVAAKIATIAMGGSEIGQIAYGALKSPGFQTWSAVNKAKFARLVEAGDVAGTAKMAAQLGVPLSGEMTPDKLAGVLRGNVNAP